jgi:hypothetical protein
MAAAVAVAAVVAPVSEPVALTDFPLDRVHCGRSRRHPTAADYRRRRVVAVGAATLLALLAWIAVRSALDRIGGGPLATTGATSAVPASLRTWVVQPGDTLWSIAVAVDRGGDVRPLVDQLDKEVGGRPLYPGEAVAIPPGW